VQHQCCHNTLQPKQCLLQEMNAPRCPNNHKKQGQLSNTEVLSPYAGNAHSMDSLAFCGIL
jgi:hypothetical protein